MSSMSQEMEIKKSEIKETVHSANCHAVYKGLTYLHNIWSRSFSLAIHILWRFSHTTLPPVIAMFIVGVLGYLFAKLVVLHFIGIVTSRIPYIMFETTSSITKFIGQTLDSGIGSLWCGIIALGYHSGRSQVDTKEEMGNVTASLIKNEVDSVTKVTNGMRNLGSTAFKINEYLVTMNSLGNQIIFMSTLPNREDIGRNLRRLGNESHNVAVTISELDYSGRRTMSIILEGYAKMIDVLEFEHEAVDELVSTNPTIISFRVALLNEFEDLLNVLQNEVESTLQTIERALNINKYIAAEIWDARGDLTVEMHKRRLSRSLEDALWDWIPLKTTVTQIEMERLKTNLGLANIAHEILDAALSELSNLDLDIRTYKKLIKYAGRGNDIGKYFMPSAEDERRLLAVIKGNLDEIQKQIGM